MGDKTGISWTDSTWNVVTGCSDLELAYFAGVVDSDGYFSITRKQGKTRDSGDRAFYYQLRVGVNQIHDIVPLLCKERLGGNVYLCDVKGRSRGWYAWSVSTRQAGVVASLLLPWLRLKVDQAETAVAFASMMSASRGRISPEMEGERETLYRRMLYLNNRRGGIRRSLAA